MSAKRIQSLQMQGDPILTNLVRGYSNADYIGLNILPAVPVEKEVGKIPSYGKGRFIPYLTHRALHANSNERAVDIRNLIAYELEEYDLAVPMDYREENATEGTGYNLETDCAEAAMEGLLLGLEKEIADLLQTQGTYPAGHVEVLSGTDLWSDPDSNPIAVISDAKETVRAKIAKEPNTLTLSYNYYRYLLDHPGIKELIKYAREAVLTIDDLKKIFDVERIEVGKAVYVEEVDENGHGTNIDIWQDCAILTYTPTSAVQSVNQPAFGYTLRYKGKPVGDSYMNQNGKVKYVRATDIRQVKVVGNESGFLITE